MHTSGDPLVNTVPAFLTKLWTLVDDPSTNELICWDSSGKSFHVLDQARFAKEILPMYFKHNNMASFIRQLNMYGFRKVMRTEPMYLKAEKDDVEFAHQFFVQGQESLLEFIKRKVSGVSKLFDESQRRERLSHMTDPLTNEEDLQRVLIEVNGMKSTQDSMTTQLEKLRGENEMLWREVASLRQRHNQQTTIVRQLLGFLMSVCGKRTTISGMKRRMPLMLEAGDGSDHPTSSAAVIPPPTKIRRSTAVLPTREYPMQTPLQADVANRHRDDKLSIEEVFEGSVPPEEDTGVPVSSLASAALHTDQSTHVYTSAATAAGMEPLALLSDDDVCTSIELTDLLDPTEPVEELYATEVPPPSSSVNQSDAAIKLEPSGAILPTTSSTNQQRLLLSASGGGGPSGASTTVKGAFGQTPMSRVTTLAVSDPVLPSSEFDRGDMSRQLETLQANIDTIKEIFTTGSYNIDPNTLFGLFNPDSNSSAQNLLYDLGLPGGTFEDYPIEHVVETTTAEESSSKAGEIQGHEVIQYVPQDDFSSLFQDLGELNTPYPEVMDDPPLYPDLATTLDPLSPPPAPSPSIFLTTPTLSPSSGGLQTAPTPQPTSVLVSVIPQSGVHSSLSQSAAAAAAPQQQSSTAVRGLGPRNILLRK